MAILRILAFMAGLTLVGLVLRRRGLLSPAHAAKLNGAALYVTLPASIVLSLHDFPVDARSLGGPAILFVLTFVLWLIADRCARHFHAAPSQRAVFVIATVLGNTAFIGYPVVHAVFGDRGLAQAVLIDQLGMEALAFTLGAVLAARGSPDAQSISWSKEFAGLLRFPPLVALACGLAWSIADLPPFPEPLRKTLGFVGSLTAPLVMLALGLVLRAGAIREAWRSALAVAGLRLVLSPLLAWGAAVLLGLESWQTGVTVLEAGMPAMMFSLVLALRYRLDVELAAAVVSVTMVGAAITLPAWVLVLRLAG